jgi:hypothetical protein
MTGVGFAVCVSCILHAMTDLAVISWSGHAIYQLYTLQSFPENFFTSKVLVRFKKLKESCHIPVEKNRCFQRGNPQFFHALNVKCFQPNFAIFFTFLFTNSENATKSKFREETLNILSALKFT